MFAYRIVVDVAGVVIGTVAVILALRGEGYTSVCVCWELCVVG